MMSLSAAEYIPLVSGFPQVTPNANDSSDFASYVNFLIRTIIGITGIIAVVMIVYGGIQYVSTDAWSEKSDGKKRIQAAVGGLVLALSSYLILNTIDPSLTYLNFADSLKPVTTVVGGGLSTIESPAQVQVGDPGEAQGEIVNQSLLNQFEAPVTVNVRTTHYHQTEPDESNDEDTKQFKSSTGIRLRDGGANIVGVVAVASAGQDKGLIPYGSIVVIDGNYYIAADTGGAVNNRTASKGEFPIVDVYAQSWQDRNTSVTVYKYKGNFLGLSAAEKEQFFNSSNYR